MGKAKRLREQRKARPAPESSESSPYPPNARSFELKMHRAKAHIDALANSVERWLQSDAYTLTEDVEPETGDHVLKAQITKPLGPDWPLIVGDAIHNLRSALDHIAYQLALDGYQAQNPGGTIPLGHQRRIMFPVVATSNDPNLSVDDFYGQVVGGQLRGDVHVKRLQVNGGPVENESEVMRWNIEAIGPQPVHMERQFSRHIALTEGPRLAQNSELIALLRACQADIADNVVPVLTPFL